MRKFLSAVGAALLLASMAGCIGSGVVKTPAPTPSATPVFASDEEALAAAEAAYAAYLAALDRAFSSHEPGGLEAVASDNALSEAVESVNSFRDRMLFATGASSADSFSLVQTSSDGYIEMYACLDVSRTDLLDSSGASVVPPNRPARFPMQVLLNWVGNSLVVSEAEVWAGENFCG